MPNYHIDMQLTLNCTFDIEADSEHEAQLIAMEDMEYHFHAIEGEVESSLEDITVEEVE